MTKLDNDDVQALREACRIAYEVTYDVLREVDMLSVAARRQIEADAKAIMRAWEHIPDTFDAETPSQ